jgi:hypothetical protein
MEFAPSRDLTIELQDLAVEFGVAGQFDRFMRRISNRRSFALAASSEPSE